MFWPRIALVSLVAWLVYARRGEILEGPNVMKDKKFNKAVCLQEPSYGECKGRRTLWYYNSFKNKCETFIYSNCGGTGNRFHTYKKCDRLCRIPKWQSSMFVTE